MSEVAMSESNPIVWQDLRSEFGFTSEEEAEMNAGREKLLSQIRAYKLAEVRKSQGETQIGVARRMGVTEARVSAIEHGELGKSEMDTLSAYVEALGGKLKLVADFGDSTVVVA
jgi:DNA-binding XRE family transcriptional regulator